MSDPLAPRPGETHKASQALKDYIALGPGRSLERLRVMYSECTESTPPTTVLRTIKHWSSTFAWQERAAQWDAQQARKELEFCSGHMAEERRKWRERRLKLLEAQFSNVARMMKHLTGKKDRDVIACSPNELDRALRTVLTESRIELADKPTPGHELIGPDGSPVISLERLRGAFREMQEIVGHHVTAEVQAAILEQWMSIPFETNRK
jgi:hypothetical protein